LRRLTSRQIFTPPSLRKSGSRSSSKYKNAACLAARNVATIVKAAAAKLGLEASAFAGHSLRAGLR
jgi:hypothetical protein